MKSFTKIIIIMITIRTVKAINWEARAINHKDQEAVLHCEKEEKRKEKEELDKQK